MKFSGLVLILAICLTSEVNAQELITGAVSQLYPHSTGRIYFKLENDLCNSGWRYYYLDDSTSDLKEANKNRYALLLSAAAAKVPVTLNVNSCTPDANEIVNEIWIDY